MSCRRHPQPEISAMHFSSCHLESARHRAVVDQSAVAVERVYRQPAWVTMASSFHPARRPSREIPAILQTESDPPTQNAI